MMRSRRGRVLLLLVAAGAATWWLWHLYRAPARGELAAYWQLVVAVITLIVTVIPVLRSVRSTRDPDDENARDAQLTELLADAVAAQWQQAADARGLLFPNPIPVAWKPPTAPIGGPADASDRFRRLPGTNPGPRTMCESGDVVKDLHDVYSREGSGRLLIVGPPGSGKSSAAVLLVLKALAHRSATSPTSRGDIPVPVLFTLQGWDPDAQPVHDWLAAQLLQTYVGIFTTGRALERARSLLLHGRLAVILDGLDEIAPNLRSVAVEALDRQATTFRLVVVSRSVEMAIIAERRLLTGASAVELQDVGPQAAADYLKRVQRAPAPPHWRELVRQLEHDPSSPVTRALRTPLALSLVRDARDDDDTIGDLLELSTSGGQVSPDDIENHLLERVVPHAYRKLPGRGQPTYCLTDAERTLRLLAQRMDRDGIQDLAWWQIGTWTSPFPRALVVGLLAATASSAVLLPVAALVAVSPLIPVGLGAFLGACSPVRQPEPVPTRWRMLLGRPALVLAAGLLIGFTVVSLVFFLGAFSLGILLWMACFAALIAAAVYWLAVRLVRTRRRTSPHARTTVGPRWPSWILLIIGVALGYVLEGGVAVSLGSSWWGVGLLVVGLLVLGLGLTFGLGSFDHQPTEATTPQSSWCDYRFAAIGMWLAVAAFAGGLQLVTLSAGLLGVGTSQEFLLTAWILGGVWVIFGLVLATTFPDSWMATLAFGQLAASSRLRIPVRLMNFLEDAREKGVLRVVGPVYQFRHARLQEILAARAVSSSVRDSVDAARPSRRFVLDPVRRVGAGGRAWWRSPSWTRPAPRAVAVGLAAAFAYWLGLPFTYPSLWMSAFAGLVGLVVAIGAGFGHLLGSRKMTDGWDARWAFLLRHPTLVFGAGAAFGFCLGKDIAMLLPILLLIDVTGGLPVGIALWLLFGLVARAVEKKRGRQVFPTWRLMNANLPLVFVVGGGLGWMVANHLAIADVTLALIASVVVAVILFGLVVVVAVVPLTTGSPADDFPDDSGHHSRPVLLFLWFTAGGLIANIVTRAAMRTLYLAGFDPRPIGWITVVLVAAAIGYVLGLMFPSSRSGRAATAARPASVPEIAR